MHYSLVFALLISSVSTETAAQALRLEDRGADLAAEFCIRCHNIGTEGVMKDYPPSFKAIAVFRDDAQIERRIWTLPYHTPMPFFAEMLGTRDVSALVAYIRGLE